jgi:small-conductance mechanosensitive channel
VFLSTLILSPDTIAAKKMKIGYFSRYLQKLTPILYVVSAIAMVSNILGYTNLTESILKACISGAVITMLFYYILLIINSISVIIIHRHFNNQTGYDVKIKIKSQRKASKIIRSIMTIIAAIIFLRLIDLLDYVFNFVEGILSKTYNIGDLTFTIGAFVSFVLILIGSFIITRLVTFTFGESDKLFNIIKLPKGIPAAISLIVRYFIFAFGVTLALSSLGIDLSKFNLMAGALGLGIGFGLQTVVSNFISGLILVFERPILPGDTVEFGNLMGTVNKIGVRSSNISTFDGAEVVVPNNNLISNNLINWTLSDSIKRIEINIGATYDADPNKVIQLLGEAALSCEKVLKTPHPLPLLNDFGSSSLNFKLRFWVPVENGLSAKSDVSIAIYNKFKENNIEIPFPQQDISIKDISESLLHNRKDNLGKS